jgi:hypothetical protein
MPIMMKNHRILVTLNIISIIFDPDNQVFLNSIKPQNVGFEETPLLLENKKATMTGAIAAESGAIIGQKSYAPRSLDTS